MAYYLPWLSNAAATAANNPTFTSLASGLGVDDAASVTIPSLTLTANRLCLLTIVNASQGGTPTCPGWEQVVTVFHNPARLTILRRMVTTDLTQAHTYSFGAGQAFSKWVISQSSANVDTTGSNGENAVVQAQTNSGLQPAPTTNGIDVDVTLGAFSSADNSTFAAFGGSYPNYSPTPGEGFLFPPPNEFAVAGVGSFAYALMTEYKAANDTFADARWSGVADIWVGAALEIKAAVGSVPDSPVWLRTSGSLVGQMTVDFLKPSYLYDGSAIADDPVTHTYIRVFSTQAAATYGTVGTPVYSGDAGTASTVTITIPVAETYWVHGVCTNSSGDSYPSQPIEVVVT